MQQIGAPRTAWWNWTESGWHALAAVKLPVEFAPEIGAIMFDHLAGGSKRMDGMEFRISWLRMLAEVRESAMQAGVSVAEWQRQLNAHQLTVFGSTCLRLSRDGSAAAAEEMRQLGRRTGLNPTLVDGAVGLASGVRRLGAGALVNGTVDSLVRLKNAMRGRNGGAAETPTGSLATAAEVLQALNGLAGVVPHHG